MAGPIGIGTFPPAVRAALRAPEAAAPGGPRRVREAPGTAFLDQLRAEVRQVNEIQVQADDSARALVTGASGDIHGTMIALAKADMSFRLLLQVRNRALEAYQEIMRMNL